MSEDVQVNVDSCEDVQISVDDCENVELNIDSCQETVSLSVTDCQETVSLGIDDCEENIDLTVLQSGVVIVSPPPNNINQAQNNDVVTIYPGQAVAVHSSGAGYVLANNDGPISNTAFAIAITQAAPGFAVTVQKDGIIDIADWTPVIGSVNFPAGSRWFLGNNGQLTQVSPTTPGEYSQNIGESCSPTCLGLRIAKPIRRN